MKDWFQTFEEALDYYRNEADIRYPEVFEMKAEERTATLVNNDGCAPIFVAIWPMKNFRGEVEPVKVWAEEY